MADEPGDALPEAVRRLVRKVATASGLSSAAMRVLELQLHTAQVVLSKPTMIDVHTPADSPRLRLPNGPMPAQAIVVDEAGDVVGEILVWVESGSIAGIEQAWYTDEPPSGWPPVGAVNVT